MFCKWCGLESETADKCSWCLRPLSVGGSSASATEQKRPAADSALPPPAATRTPDAPPPSLAAPTPFGGSFDDDDDDLSLNPFGGHSWGVQEPAPKPSAVPSAAAVPLAHTPPPPTRLPDDLPPPAARTPNVALPSPTRLPDDPVIAPTKPLSQPAASPAPAAPPTGVAPVLRSTNLAPTPTPAVAPAAPVVAPVAQPVAPPVPPVAPPVVAPPPVVNVAPVVDRPQPPPMTPLPLKDRLHSEPPMPPAVPGLKLRTPGQTSPAPPAPAPPVQATPPASGPPALPPRGTLPSQPLGRPSAPAAKAPSLAPRDLTAPVEDIQLAPLQPLDEEPSIGVAPIPGRIDIGGGSSQGLNAPMTPSQNQKRTFYCRWCGMNSEAPDVCTWCRRSLSANAPSIAPKAGPVTPTKPPKKGSGRQPVAKNAPVPSGVRPSSGGPSPLPARSPLPPPRPAAGTPSMGAVTTAKSKYYEDKVMDAVSGAHYDHETGEVERELDDSKIVVEEVNEMRQAGIGFFLFVALLGMGAALVSNAHIAFLPVYGLLCALMGHILPIMRAVPYFSDDDEDWQVAGGLTLLVGPLVGGAAYGVIGIIRQGSWNPAVVGLFFVAIATRIAFELATGAGAEMFSKMMPFADTTGIGFAKQYMLLAGLFAWIAADMWKKADE